MVIVICQTTYTGPLEVVPLLNQKFALYKVRVDREGRRDTVSREHHIAAAYVNLTGAEFVSCRIAGM